MTTTHDQEGGHGYGVYVRAWLWLLVLMALKVAVVSVSLPRGLMVALLLLLMAMKVSLIGAYFMHLRYERLGLVYMALTPLILTVVVFFGISPDFGL